MDFNHIIDEIVKVDPEFQERISPRRAAIKNITSFGSKVAVASLPFALGTLFKKAYGQTSTTATVLDILNYALTAEYLESSFYNMYVKQGSFIPADHFPGLELIRVDENNHTKFVMDTIKSLGGTPVSSPKFDYTGGAGTGAGPYANVGTNYDTFLAVSQAFEDNGVRAYKGGAPALMSNPTVLTAALNIHSVEARHASHLRYLRMLRNVAVKPWITGTTSGLTGPGTAVYLGGTGELTEANTVQATVDITKFVSANAATEAFDEPSTKAYVTGTVLPPFLGK
jgi:hypothetical protein